MEGAILTALSLSLALSLEGENRFCEPLKVNVTRSPLGSHPSVHLAKSIFLNRGQRSVHEYTSAYKNECCSGVRAGQESASSRVNSRVSLFPEVSVC